MTHHENSIEFDRTGYGLWACEHKEQKNTFEGSQKDPSLRESCYDMHTFEKMSAQFHKNFEKKHHHVTLEEARDCCRLGPWWYR